MDTIVHGWVALSRRTKTQTQEEGGRVGHCLGRDLKVHFYAARCAMAPTIAKANTGFAKEHLA